MIRRVLLSAALLALSLPLAAQASPILDQEFVPNPASASAYIFGPTPPTFPTIFQETSQTFTVGQSGTLAQVDVLLRTRGTPPGDLTLEIQGTLSGAPDGNVLASVSMTPAEIGTLTSPTFVSFDVAGFGIGVLAGAQLAIVLTSVDSTLGDDYGFSGDSAGTYTGGEAYLRSQGTGLWESWDAGAIDFGFRTYLVPEPSTAGLLALGLAALAARTRRARS